eukprot:8667879-Ditylum_brightwellii.AAC.1
MREISMKIGELPLSHLLLWDSETGFAPDQKGHWSEYYKNNSRRPEITNELPYYSASRYQRLQGGVICDLPFAPDVPVRVSGALQM